jgi:uncharacterized protein YcbK (DUF882 family)
LSKTDQPDGVCLNFVLRDAGSTRDPDSKVEAFYWLPLVRRPRAHRATVVVNYMKSGIRHCTLWLIALLLAAPPGLASDPSSREYRLRFYHTHTNERLDIVYRRGENYVPEALAELDHYLRDHRTGEVHHFDPHLFDLLYDLTASLNDPGGEIDVICGYRTPWSNEFLRTRSAHTGVAVHSLHMQAEAIDIRLPGIATTALRDGALRLQRGGVGYYRDSNFVHVDVGRVRRW